MALFGFWVADHASREKTARYMQHHCGAEHRSEKQSRKGERTIR